MATSLVGAFLVGYLLGGLMPAVWITRVVKGFDIRGRGSMNAGTSNVFTEVGPIWGMLTFLSDLAKVVIPLVLGRQVFHLSYEVLMAMGLGGVIGHDFPIWFRFKGGKGTAAALALAFCLHWLAGTAVLMTLVVVALVFDRMSIGGMVAMAALPASLFLLGFSPPVVGMALIVPVLSIFMHHSNIRKIIDGTEPYLLAAIKKAGKEGT